jgi:hypothetical protein
MSSLSAHPVTSKTAKLFKRRQAAATLCQLHMLPASILLKAGRIHAIFSQEVTVMVVVNALIVLDTETWPTCRHITVICVTMVDPLIASTLFALYYSNSMKWQFIKKLDHLPEVYFIQCSDRFLNCSFRVYGP